MVEIKIPYPLTPEAAKALHDTVQTVILDAIKSVSETDDGFVLNFGRDGSVIHALCQLIEIERVVNPFLRMALSVESSQGPIKLDFSGPVGTKDFLVGEFGLKRWLV